MILRINDTDHHIPTELSQFTVQQFLDYQEWQGRELDKQLKAILESKDYEDELLREFDLSAHEDKEALAWVSFFSGIDLRELQGAEAVPIVVAYRQVKLLLLQSEDESMTGPMDVEWKGEVWEIKDHRVTPTSDYTVNELVTSKEVMRQLYTLGLGKWESIPYLCAVFFRHKGEVFTDALVADGSPRLQLMYSLPMDIAVRVAFFLTVSIHIWNSHLAYSDQHPEELTEDSADTMNGGAGLTSSPLLQKQKSSTYPAAAGTVSNAPKWPTFIKSLFGRRRNETTTSHTNSH